MFLRLIIILLSIFATILPVYAQGETFTDGDFRFRTINDNECEIIGAEPNYPSRYFIIPSAATFNGNSYTVTAIGKAAFKEYEDRMCYSWEDNEYFNLASLPYKYTGELTIPPTIVTIGDSAFFACRGLYGDLIIPNSVKSIGKYAFANTGGRPFIDSVRFFGGGRF